MQHRALRLRLVGCGRLACAAWPGLSAGHATVLCQTWADGLPVAQQLGLVGRLDRACDHPHFPFLAAYAPCPRVLPAAIARRVYLRGDVGVGAFKKIFGGRAHRGTRPEKFATGSGAIARHILRQLEALKIVEHIPEGKEGHRKGCVAAPGALPGVSTCSSRWQGLSRQELLTFRLGSGCG